MYRKHIKGRFDKDNCFEAHQQTNINKSLKPRNLIDTIVLIDYSAVLEIPLQSAPPVRWSI